jgi:transcriptional regulator with XRE-family HTH domain
MPMDEQNNPHPLKALRIARGLTQTDLARAIGRHPATISIAERSGFVSRDMARRAAAVLGCAPEDLEPRGVRP